MTWGSGVWMARSRDFFFLPMLMTNSHFNYFLGPICINFFPALPGTSLLLWRLASQTAVFSGPRSQGPPPPVVFCFSFLVSFSSQVIRSFSKVRRQSLWAEAKQEGRGATQSDPERKLSPGPPGKCKGTILRLLPKMGATWLA